MTAPSPRSFGKYLLEREIARGGMARVHLATLRGLGGFEKRLVVKEILPELASDPRFVAMFVEEAKVLVALSHPNIVPVYELGIVDGTYFLAMEHVEGATLAELVAKRPLGPGQAARVGAQVADALAYAHERFGIVHRDVSPRNVMVDVAGHTRLLDFGIAARAEPEEDTGLYGTPGFLSPEQARGERLSPASDLFALGCVLHFALTGRSPFAADDLDGVRSLKTSPELSLSDADARLAPILRDLLAPTPEARPASARSVARALSALSVSLDGLSDEDTAANRLAALATEIRSGAPRESELPSSGDPLPITPGRVETLAKSQALDALLAPTPIAPPTDDGPRTARIERAPKTAETPAPEAPEPLLPTLDARDPDVAPVAEAPSPRDARATRVIAAIVAALVAGALVSLARFEQAPVEPVDPIDRGLTSAADIVPLPLEPDDASTVDAGTIEIVDAASSADASSSVDAASSADAGVPEDAGSRARDAGARASGSVSVRATPWARVVLDGRSLGTTPIRRTSVSSGSHTLRLDCPPLGRRVDTTFRVEPGHVVEISADLDRDPPTITVTP